MTVIKKNTEGVSEIEFQGADLSFALIVNTKKNTLEMIDQANVQLKFSALIDFDSAGLQFLLFFIREVKSRNGKISMESVPAEIESLAHLFGIEEMSFFGGNHV